MGKVDQSQEALAMLEYLRSTTSVSTSQGLSKKKATFPLRRLPPRQRTRRRSQLRIMSRDHLRPAARSLESCAHVEANSCLLSSVQVEEAERLNDVYTRSRTVLEKDASPASCFHSIFVRAGVQNGV